MNFGNIVRNIDDKIKIIAGNEEFILPKKEDKHYSQYFLCVSIDENGNQQFDLHYEAPTIAEFIIPDNKFDGFWQSYSSPVESLFYIKPVVPVGQTLEDYIEKHQKDVNNFKVFDIDSFVETNDGVDFINLNKIDFDKLKNHIWGILKFVE